MNKKLKNIYQFLSFTLCSVCLLYQVLLLFQDYLSFRTVANIQLYKNKPEILPGITICHPGIISFEFISYLGNESQNLNASDQNKGDILYSRYRDISRKIIKKFKQKINMAYLENYIYDSSSLIRNIFIDGNLIEKKLPAELSNKTRLGFAFTGKPIQSIDTNNKPFGVNVNDIMHFNCFTYFTIFKSIKFIIKDIFINLRFQAEKIPPSVDFFYLSLHSANYIPNTVFNNNFIRIDPSREYSVLYSRINTLLLGRGYDTDCHDYDECKSGKCLNLRTDCLMNSTQMQFRKLCNGNIANINMMMRIDYLRTLEGQKLTWCGKHLGNMTKIKTLCEEMCKRDCYSTYYYYTLKEERFMNKTSKLTIVHNAMPDINIKHMPELNFISFISNLGGLIGMWSGLSAFGLMDDLPYFIMNVFNINRNINIIVRSKIEVKPQINIH